MSEVTREIKELPKSQVEITVRIPWDQWKKEVEHTIIEHGKDMKQPGFRKGKVPRDMIVESIGMANILAHAAEHAISHDWQAVMDEGKIDPVGSPQAEILKIAEENDLEFKLTTSVVPVLVLKKDWREKIKKANKKNAKNEVENVSDEEVNKEVSKLVESRAKRVVVDREAKSGDVVRVDFRVTREGVPIENGSGRDHELLLGSGTFIEGFEENVIGMKAGEEKSIKLTFPKEYHEKTLAGKPATFEITLKSVEEREIPEINDEFVKSLGRFETLEALQKSIREGMQEERDHKKKEADRGALLETLNESAAGEIPDIMIENELNRMITQFEQQLSMMGFSVDHYLSQIGKERKEMEAEWQMQAEKKVRSALAITAVTKEQEIEATSEEIESEMNETLMRYRKVEDAQKDIDLERLHRFSRDSVLGEKAIVYLEELK